MKYNPESDNELITMRLLTHNNMEQLIWFILRVTKVTCIDNKTFSSVIIFTARKNYFSCTKLDF